MDFPECPVVNINSLLVIDDEPDEFVEYGDIADLPPIIYSSAHQRAQKKIYRENNLTYDTAMPVARLIFPIDMGLHENSEQMICARGTADHRFANFII